MLNMHEDMSMVCQMEMHSTTPIDVLPGAEKNNSSNYYVLKFEGRTQFM